MDHARLARETVDKLAPYLKELMERQPPDPEAPPRKVEAFRLWKLIYPKIALRSGVIQAAKKIIEENTVGNRAALTQQLTQVYRTNEHIALEVMQIIRKERVYEDEPPARQHPDYLFQSPSAGTEFSAEQVSCQECGIKDETLRLVSYPYVVSLIIVTFRRVFQGVYCARHANRYYFLAVFITMTVGWLGIPFGFLFTPLTLSSLLTVDKKLRPANAKLLLEIAKAKLEAEAPQSAAVYLKESLWLEDSEQVRDEAQKLVSELKPLAQPEYAFQLAVSLFAFLTIWMMGFLIGMIDGVISLPLEIGGGDVSVLVMIFSYLPLLLLLIFGSYLGAHLSGDTARRMMLRTKWGGRLFAIILSLGAVYAILTGKFLVHTQMNLASRPKNMVASLFYYGGLIFNGGWRLLSQIFIGQAPAYLLFLVIVLLGGVLFLWSCHDHISQTVQWQQALDEITGTMAQESGSRAVLMAGIVIMIFTLVFGSIFFFTG